MVQDRGQQELEALAASEADLPARLALQFRFLILNMIGGVLWVRV